MTIDGLTDMQIERNTMDKLISEQAVLKILDDYHRAWFLNDKRFMEMVNVIKAIQSTEPKIGHCKNCKHFRKLPYHAGAIGKCVQHWGFCPPSDWYCADFEPQESEVSDADSD